MLAPGCWNIVRIVSCEFTLIGYLNPFFMKQSLYFVCADGGTIRFIIDIKEINFAFFHRYNNSKSDDPCATTFTLSFGGDLHTNFAETTSKVDTESGILCQFIKECGIVICDGCVVFTKPLDFFIERFGCFLFYNS